MQRELQEELLHRVQEDRHRGARQAVLHAAHLRGGGARGVQDGLRVREGGRHSRRFFSVEVA